VTFQVGTNLDVAQVQVQKPGGDRIAATSARGAARGYHREEGVAGYNPGDSLYFSPDGSHDALFISNYVTLQLKDQIARLPGRRRYEFVRRGATIRCGLWLDPEKMATRNITAGDVVRRGQRAEHPGWQPEIVGGPPLPKESSAFQYTLNAQGRLTEPSEFADIVVKVGADGRITQLKDIGRVELGGADYGTTVNYDGHAAVGLAVFPATGHQCDRHCQRDLRQDEGA